MVPERIVIVGGGQAGGWAAKTLRDNGFAGRLVLVGNEAHPPYERPPLSKAVLAGAVPPEKTRLFKDALFDGLALDWRRGRRAQRIDRAAKRVHLDDGSDLAYDRLLICTGGRARPWDRNVPHGVAVLTLRTLDDALALRAHLGAGTRLLVVGGGWIGLEVAATARQQGVDVHVVEALPRLCARALPPVLSERLAAVHRGHGVGLSLGTTVERIEAIGSAGAGVTLANGEVLGADCLVAGLGMHANDELAREAGLECRHGIVVDHLCATSDPAIFAAGDVAVARNRWADDHVRLESWQNAQDQGIAAGLAMLDRLDRYDPVPRFWSDQYDLNIQIVGLAAADDRLVIRGRDTAGPFIAFALRDGLVRAAIGFNAGREMRTARRLVETRAAIAPERLADPAADLNLR